VPDIKNGEKYTRPGHFFVFISNCSFDQVLDKSLEVLSWERSGIRDY
jgi:hypothetical protein